MQPPLELRTDRLILRAPNPGDAEAIFTRYAADPEVTRFLGWPRHRSIEDTHAFLESDMVQREEGTGFAYLIVSADDGRLLGSTGLTIEDGHRAMTGYVLARDAWAHGYATEALTAMVGLAFGTLGVWRLYAYCHVAHSVSEAVLARGGFSREGTLRRYAMFPNLGADEPQDVAIWARVRSAPETAHDGGALEEPTMRLARRIAVRRGVPDLVELLSDGLSRSELTSVLLAVSSNRTRKRQSSFAQLLSQYQSDRALVPSPFPGGRLRAIDDAAFAAASEFEAVEIAPVQPIGLNAATGVHQNNVVSTVRSWEVVADPTGQLALEAAQRRRADRSHTVRLCSSVRAMRLQPTDVKGYSPHFRLFGLVSAGRATADEAFERDELGRHAIVMVRLLRDLGVRVVRVELSDVRATRALLATAGVTEELVRAQVRAHKPTSGLDLLAGVGVQLPLIEGDIGAALSGLPLPAEHRSRLLRMHERTAAPLAAHLGIPVRVEVSRLQGLGYYDTWRLAVVVGDDAGEAAVGDGGVVDWTQAMLSDKKERLVASGIGVEYLAARFVAGASV
jgi:RimJ/RimL family protein N-acetyltransferase